MRINSKILHLRPWEEAVGVLTEFADEDNLLLVNIGKLSLALPLEMADVLRPHLGQRIAILRTDNRARPYRFRNLMGMKNPPADDANTGVFDENYARVSKAQVPSTKKDVDINLGGGIQ